MNSDLLWRQYDRFRRRKSAQHTPAVYRALQAQIKHFAQTGKVDEIPMQPIYDAVKDIYTDAGKQWALQTYYNTLKEAGLKHSQMSQFKRAPIGFNAEFINSILNYFNTQLLTEATIPITETTQEWIRQQLTRGINEGLGIDEIVNGIIQSPITRRRAELIARTEVMRASNLGEQIGVDKTGLDTQKVWIAIRDNRTRRDHNIVDNSIVADGEPFNVGGWLMQRPGDPESEDGRKVPASEICNCRCTVGRKVNRDPVTGLPMRRQGANIRTINIPARLRQQPIQPPPPATPVKPSFRPAATLKEAEQFAKENLDVKFVSFKGLHLAVANDINKSVYNTKAAMPTIRTNGVGSAQAANKAMKTKIVEAYKATDHYQKMVATFGEKMADSGATSWANRYVPKVRQGVIAWSTNQETVPIPGGKKLDVSEFVGVFVNEKEGKTKEALDAMIRKNRDSKWFTESANDFGYVMSHEIGHEIDKTIGFRAEAEFKAIFDREHAFGVEGVTNRLSRYAATAGGNKAHLEHEMIAESWAEFITSSNPRPLAKEVGELMLKKYYEQHKQNINQDFYTWYADILKIVKE